MSDARKLVHEALAKTSGGDSWKCSPGGWKGDEHEFSCDRVTEAVEARLAAAESTARLYREALEAAEDSFTRLYQGVMDEGAPPEHRSECARRGMEGVRAALAAATSTPPATPEAADDVQYVECRYHDDVDCPSTCEGRQ